MSKFNLKIQFTNEQLGLLKMMGSNVIIAKPTGGDNPNVAWQVFSPLQHNTVGWEEKYGVYASTTQVTNGATLDQLSKVDVGALMNKVYTLQDSGAMTGPTNGQGAAKDSFSLVNKYDKKDFMTVGLYQDARVNGTEIAGNALSAAPVLLASTAIMTPYTTVYVWLQSKVVSNTVVTSVTSPMTELRFGGGVDEISVKYDRDTGFFINNGEELRLDANKIIKGINPIL